MTVVAIREVTPKIGKEELTESRMARAADIATRHGAKSSLWKVAVGHGAGDYALMNMYETFAKGAIAFKGFSSDPDMVALRDEVGKNPGAELRGPNVYRMAYGVPDNPPRPVLGQRLYHMPRKNMAAALALAPELDKLMQTQDVTIGIGVPIVAEDHEMMGIVYRFNSIEHWGQAVDAMVENQEFSSLVEQANALGTLKASRILLSM